MVGGKGNTLESVKNYLTREIEDAEIHLQSYDFEEAKEKSSSAIAYFQSLDPYYASVFKKQYGRLLHLLGRSDYALKEYREALGSLLRATILNPDDADSYYFAAIIYHETGHERRAAEHYFRAINLYEKSGRVENERKTYRIDTLYGLANIYMQNNMPDMAIKCYKRAIAIEPRSSQTAFNLAEAYRMARRYSKAANTYHWSIYLGTLNQHFASLAFFKMGLCFTETKELGKALEAFEISYGLGFEGAIIEIDSLRRLRVVK